MNYQIYLIIGIIIINFTSILSVLYAEKDPYFCHLISNHNIKYAKNHLKIYIPLDSNHIEDGVKMTFDCSKHSMPIKSSKRIRFDDIVIRVIHPKNVEKIIKFVNDNFYLKSGLIPLHFKKIGLL